MLITSYPCPSISTFITIQHLHHSKLKEVSKMDMLFLTMDCYQTLLCLAKYIILQLLT